MTEDRTIYLDGSTDDQRASLGEFLGSIEAPAALAESADEAHVIIDWPDERRESEYNRLHSGGRISCAEAFKAAGLLRMERGDMGRLLNLLEIKIHSCQLGCFP